MKDIKTKHKVTIIVAVIGAIALIASSILPNIISTDKIAESELISGTISSSTEAGTSFSNVASISADDSLSESSPMSITTTPASVLPYEANIINVPNDGGTNEPTSTDTATSTSPLPSEASFFDDICIIVSDETKPTFINEESTESSPVKLILHADNKNGKWGYVDQFGTERIAYVYDWADDFFDEYAAVYNGISWGFISENGTEEISFKYNGAWSFIDGFAPVYNGDKWGFIDKEGNLKIPYKFNNISRTYNGDKQVYVDDNNNIIDYSAETS